LSGLAEYNAIFAFCAEGGRRPLTIMAEQRWYLTTGTVSTRRRWLGIASRTPYTYAETSCAVRRDLH